MCGPRECRCCKCSCWVAKSVERYRTILWKHSWTSPQNAPEFIGSHCILFRCEFGEDNAVSICFSLNWPLTRRKICGNTFRSSIIGGDRFCYHWNGCRLKVLCIWHYNDDYGRQLDELRHELCADNTKFEKTCPRKSIHVSKIRMLHLNDDTVRCIELRRINWSDQCGPQCRDLCDLHSDEGRQRGTVNYVKNSNWYPFNLTVVPGRGRFNGQGQFSMKFILRTVHRCFIVHKGENADGASAEIISRRFDELSSRWIKSTWIPCECRQHNEFTPFAISQNISTQTAISSHLAEVQSMQDRTTANHNGLEISQQE